jgi:hypothetical protein
MPFRALSMRRSRPSRKLILDSLHVGSDVHRLESRSLAGATGNLRRIAGMGIFSDTWMGDSITRTNTMTHVVNDAGTSAGTQALSVIVGGEQRMTVAFPYLGNQMYNSGIVNDTRGSSGGTIGYHLYQGTGTTPYAAGSQVLVTGSLTITASFTAAAVPSSSPAAVANINFNAGLAHVNVVTNNGIITVKYPNNGVINTSTYANNTASISIPVTYSIITQAGDEGLTYAVGYTTNLIVRDGADITGKFSFKFTETVAAYP